MKRNKKFYQEKLYRKKLKLYTELSEELKTYEEVYKKPSVVVDYDKCPDYLQKDCEIISHCFFTFMFGDKYYNSVGKSLKQLESDGESYDLDFYKYVDYKNKNVYLLDLVNTNLNIDKYFYVENNQYRLKVNLEYFKVGYVYKTQKMVDLYTPNIYDDKIQVLKNNNLKYSNIDCVRLESKWDYNYSNKNSKLLNRYCKFDKSKLKHETFSEKYIWDKEFQRLPKHIQEMYN